MNQHFVLYFLRFLTIMLLPNLALAYVGPGAGISAIGTVLALIGAVLLGIVGFVWYPIKRLLRSRRALDTEEVDENSNTATSTTEQPDTERRE